MVNEHMTKGLIAQVIDIVVGYKEIYRTMYEWKVRFYAKLDMRPKWIYKQPLLFPKHSLKPLIFSIVNLGVQVLKKKNMGRKV